MHKAAFLNAPNRGRVHVKVGEELFGLEHEAIEEQPKQIIDKIAMLFRIKEGSLMSPEMYLGMDVQKWPVNDMNGHNVPCFALGANSYVKESIRIAKPQAEKHNIPYPTSKKTGKTPFNQLCFKI